VAAETTSPAAYLTSTLLCSTPLTCGARRGVGRGAAGTAVSAASREGGEGGPGGAGLTASCAVSAGDTRRITAAAAVQQVVLGLAEGGQV